MVNTKICAYNERKLDKGINSGYYRIYQKREKDFNSFRIDFFEELNVYIYNNGHDVTEYLTNVKRAEIVEYKNRTGIMFFNKKDDKITDYEFETALNQKTQINSLSIRYHTLLGSKYFSFNISPSMDKMKKEKFLDKTFSVAPVSHLLITEGFEKLYQKKAISLSIVSYPDYTETRIVNLQDGVKFKVSGRTIKNITKMKITEKQAEAIIEFYDTKESLVKEIKGSNIIKHKGRLLCLKTEGIFNDIIHLTESDYYQSDPFLDSTKELSKRLLPME